jgi:predicted MFS family arabinose efflux permease
MTASSHLGEERLEPDPWPVIVGITIVTVFTTMAYGLLNPLLIVNLQMLHASGMTTGAVIGIWAAPISLLGPVYAKLSSRIPSRDAMMAALVLSALPIFLIGFTRSPYIWMLLQIVGGSGFGLFWVTSAAVLLRIAPVATRGRVMALYGLAHSIGALCGSMLPYLTGYSGWQPFSLSGSIMMAAVLVVAFTRVPSIEVARKEGLASIRTFFGALPALFLVALLSGVFQSVPWGLITAYAIRKGLSVTLSVVYLNALFLGVILFAWLLGALVDKLSPKRVLLMLSAAAAGLSLVLPLVAHWPLIAIAVLLLWGPVINAFSSTSVVLLGSVVASSMLVSANSAFVVAANFGEIVGPPAAGSLMDVFGPDAMPVFLAFSALLIGIFVLFAGTSSGPSTAEAIPLGGRE